MAFQGKLKETRRLAKVNHFNEKLIKYMPKIVIKKDGRKEEFIPEKIVVAAIKSGAPPEKAREIAGKVDKIEREEIETEEIRRIVLDELKKANPVWHERWLEYDKQIKRLYKHYKHGLYE